MQELIHIRVFKLKRGRYRLPFPGMTFEQYVVAELQNGYVMTDMTPLGSKQLRVITYYAPTRAKQYLETGSMVSNLADTPAEEV